MTEQASTEQSEPQVAQFDIGEMLSSKRHQNHEKLSDAASNTRLAQDVLEKLENNQFSDIGTPVYVRGYLGLYAKYLGLDAAYIIDQYNQQYPAESVAIRPSGAHAFGETRKQSKRHSKALSLLVVALIVGGLAYGYTKIEPLFINKAIEATHAEQTDAPKDGISTAIDKANEAQNLADNILSGDSITNASSLVTDIDLELAVDSADKQTAPQNTEKTSAEDTAKKDDSAQQVADKEKTEENKPADENSDTAKISMTFKKDCWIKVTDADKKTLATGIYKGNKALNVSGKKPLLIKIGDRSAVSSVMLNDKAVSLADYKISRVRYRFPKAQ